jgi:DNA-binding transcriptional LysR family regulator
MFPSKTNFDKVKTKKVSMLDLRQLSYFIAVAETENVGHAAARLGISQSPLSRQIMQLEAHLGLTLFERSRQRVHLTAEGRLFLTEARAVLAQAERVEGEARGLGRGESCVATIGYTEGAVHAGVLPQAIRRMQTQHLDVALTLNAMRSGRQIQAMRSREIDVGFLYTPPDAADPDIVHALALDDPLILAVPVDDALARQGTATPKDLDGRAWIGSSRYNNAATRDRFLATCAASGFTPDIRFEADEPLTMLGLVGAGLGVTLSQASLRSLGLPGVAFVEVPWFTLSVKIYVAKRHSDNRRHILTLYHSAQQLSR